MTRLGSLRRRAARRVGTGKVPRGGRVKPSGDAARQEARWRKVVATVESDGPCLLGQGSVTAKKARGRVVWVLRYRVRLEARTIHRSIYLGADEGGQLR